MCVWFHFCMESVLSKPAASRLHHCNTCVFARIIGVISDKLPVVGGCLKITYLLKNEPFCTWIETLGRGNTECCFTVRGAAISPYLLISDDTLRSLYVGMQKISYILFLYVMQHKHKDSMIQVTPQTFNPITLPEEMILLTFCFAMKISIFNRNRFLALFCGKLGWGNCYCHFLGSNGCMCLS